MQERIHFIRCARAALICCALLLFTAGCSSDEEAREEDEGQSAAELYEEARQALDTKSYDYAVQLYKALQSRYPFGRHAEQAQLELAYAYYRNRNPELALSTLNRFIRTYPTHPNVDYAYYLKGLVNFQRDRGFFSRMFGMDQTSRDLQHARAAFADFADLIQRFPDSPYAAEARERMVYIRDELAAFEINVARHYMDQDAYVAAANRAKFVVENFQETRHVTTALAIMIQAYEALGLDELAADARRVLELNDAEMAANTEDEEEGFFSRLWPW